MSGGEQSKLSGEVGEKLADIFLGAIGWKDKISSIDIHCSNRSHLTAKGQQRGTHGVDRVFLYNNPFYESRTDVVHISVKNNIKGYKASESGIKTEFRSHLDDINQMMACAKYDGQLQELASQFRSRKTWVHLGLLIWLQSKPECVEQDIRPVIANTKVDAKWEETVYVVDSARASFIIKSIDDARERTGNHYSFYYPTTSMLSDKSDERYGEVLPIELIAANLLPIKGEIDGRDVLLLYSSQGFSIDAYKRLIAIALDYVDAWTRTILIGFPDFDSIAHRHEASAALMAFADRKKVIEPFSFNKNLLTRLGDSRS